MITNKIKLYTTPLSHFSRKVRLLLDLYEIPHEIVDIGNIADTSTLNFGDNPLARIPVLYHGSEWLIESDYIAEYLVNHFDHTDRYRVKCQQIMDLKIRAILNGVMAEDVTYIIAKRMGVPIEKYQFFNDVFDSMNKGIEWLEKNAEYFTPENPGYREFHLVIALDHLEYFNFLSFKPERLLAITNMVSANPIVKSTSPWVLRPRKALLS